MNILYLIFVIVTLQCIWAQTEKNLASKIFQVPCTKDSHCSQFMGEGAICKNSECICEDGKKCNLTRKPSARVRSTVIGEDCGDDFNCNIQYSVCSEGYCICEKNRVASADKRKCLTVASGLGQTCDESVQCARSTSGAICQDNKCVCDEKYHQVEFECFEKVGLSQACSNDSQCSHIKNSHCGLILCECDVGFVESSSNTKCLPIIKNKDDPCEDTEQCRELYGYAAACLFGQCECDGVHRLANTTCPSRLKKVCESDKDCKHYAEDPTMHCDNGKCECLAPYVEEDGICNGSPSLVTISSITSLGTVLLILLSYLK